MRLPRPLSSIGQRAARFIFGGIKMKISTIRGLYRYAKQNSGFSGHTVHSVILALGYSFHQSREYFKELSGVLQDCSEHGADTGFSGFQSPSETIAFFQKHRYDIISHMEQTAADLGTDIISMVQGFGVFRNSTPPTPGQVGKALWDSGHYWPELNKLYNVFAWYALEEIARTWYRYLEDNPAYHAELCA
jgi:hypothetical protein